MQQSARAGLEMINRDLMLAGFETPPAMAILWTNGIDTTDPPLPDSITIVYADENVPTSQPVKCKDREQTAYLDPGGNWLGLSRLGAFFLEPPCLATVVAQFK